ncbi:uncharacterized protein AB675_3331 [Cyphellophora attinorum]|uniref:F-box domain-containing protein n=1 Tax=Cyphellophora attinorum TaxID=1664694 RepID=A0A0N1H8F5_9EURO|nr:uncharacterized protein AB675_3331 [Phialophora attinorum]KPI39610.1 hypothetical protein AB675_3331 [Phialophora attinorum]
MDGSVMASVPDTEPQQRNKIPDRVLLSLPNETLLQIIEDLATSSTISLVLSSEQGPASPSGRRGLVALPFVNERLQKIIKSEWANVITLATIQIDHDELHYLSEAFHDNVSIDAHDYLRLSGALTIQQVRETVRHIELVYRRSDGPWTNPEGRFFSFRMLPRLLTLKIQRTEDIEDINLEAGTFTAQVVDGKPKPRGSRHPTGDLEFGSPAELGAWLEQYWDHNNSPVLRFRKRAKTIRVTLLKTTHWQLTHVHPECSVEEQVEEECPHCRERWALMTFDVSIDFYTPEEMREMGNEDDPEDDYDYYSGKYS